MPPRSRAAQPLAYSLHAGAVYDAVFAFLIVAFPVQVGRTFRLPLPGERFYLWLIAFFLATLAAFYFLVARDPLAHPGFLRLAIATRLIGGTVLAAAACGRPDLSGLLAVASGDVIFGLAHLAFWRTAVR